jgi:hypothetical protein
VNRIVSRGEAIGAAGAQNESPGETVALVTVLWSTIGL